MSRTRFRTGLALAALSLLPAAATATPNDKLRKELKPLAAAICDVVKQEGQTTIAVGDFVAPPQHPANYGAGLRQMLVEEMNALQSGVVNPKSVVSLTGDYQFVHNKQKDLTVIRLSVTIRKSDGTDLGRLAQELTQKPVTIDDSEVIAAMLGVTTPLPPVETKADRNERIVHKVEKPTYYQNGTRVSSAEGSPFAVEVLVLPKEKAPHDAAGWADVAAREVKSVDGRPFVDVRRDEVYALRIYNGGKYDAAVSLSVDGLDMFTFSDLRGADGRPKYSVQIIGPGQSVLAGWHRNNESVDSFLVTEYGLGASSKVPHPAADKVGVLTLTFALAWEGDEPPPELARSTAMNETGIGPPAKVNLKEVKRHVGPAIDVISLRYTH